MAASSRASCAGLLAMPVLACGGDGGGAPNPKVAIEKTAATSGDNQLAPPGGLLPAALRVMVTRDGIPEASAVVTWTSSNPGAIIAGVASTLTDAAGITTKSVSLGPIAGPQSFVATLTAGGSVTVAAPAQNLTPVGGSVTVGNDLFKSLRNGTMNAAVNTTAPGGKVTWKWVNTGTAPHSVRSQSAPGFASSATSDVVGNTYSVTFPAAGTFEYDCAIHGALMTGRVVVQ